MAKCTSTPYNSIKQSIFAIQMHKLKSLFISDSRESHPNSHHAQYTSTKHPMTGMHYKQKPCHKDGADLSFNVENAKEAVSGGRAMAQLMLLTNLKSSTHTFILLRNYDDQLH